ncbi:Rpn family recombination-promoting nuclease/putative transposase [Thiorhodovibrio winogradskyi]|nr:Rpn family recombination-promoting nuclease/putative transposase [Thiorhodovibrio winogradskyi]
MTYLTDRYINFFTDYGFKRLFGEEPNKDLLRDFLNELLKEEQGRIVDLTYLKDEQLGSGQLDRKAIFDLYCENERGEKFIVELQKAKQNFFKDRSVYYATFPIQQQARKGKWDFQLNAVYTIGILDFVFDEDKKEPGKYRYDIKLQDIVTNEVFYDKLTFIYLELPKFNKTLDQLENRFEKWLYAIKHLDRLDRVPDALREQVFEKFFAAAEIANFSREEIQRYEDSLKYYRDLKNCLDTAREEGIEEGIIKVARNLLDLLDDDTIAAKTGLRVEVIADLRRES